MNHDASDQAGASRRRNLLLAILGLILLSAIGIPNFLRWRGTAASNTCRNNLQQLDGAKGSWALENKKKPGDPVTNRDLFGRDRYLQEMPRCPLGGSYLWGVLAESPRCSFPLHNQEFNQHSKEQCTQTLKKIRAALERWAAANNKTNQTNPAPTIRQILPYFQYAPKSDRPLGDNYKLGKMIGASPSCTLSDHRE